jgi:hypothetical protein
MFDPKDLSQFSGTAQWYRHWATGILYTDGVQYIGANGCGWLVDLIALAQPRLSQHLFQVWKLTADKDQHADLIVEDGNDHVIDQQYIEFTSWPSGHGELQVWVSEGVMLLPSEY